MQIFKWLPVYNPVHKPVRPQMGPPSPIIYQPLTVKHSPPVHDSVCSAYINCITWDIHSIFQSLKYMSFQFYAMYDFASLSACSGWEDECGGSEQSWAADSSQYLGGRAGGPGCCHPRTQSESIHKTQSYRLQITHWIWNNKSATTQKQTFLCAFQTLWALHPPKRMSTNGEGVCKQETKEAGLVKTMAQERFPSTFISPEH